MTQEGMSLTKDEKQIISNCLRGKSTFEKERNKIISECRQYTKNKGDSNK